jgi:NAD+ synthase
MNLIEDISSWIKQRIEEASAEGAVFGLSGGIDSCCAGVLCKKSLGDKALALIMPCRSTSEDEKDARLVADKFNIKTERIELDSLYDKFLHLLPESSQLAEANIKSRLRMITLYYFANNLNYLVVGTSNKSELKIGYFTKHGDGAADILPLGGLLKTEVKKLAKDLKIPDEIIQKPPSAGLWQGQTDEKELGVNYEQLDEIISLMEEGKEEEISDKDILNKIKNMIQKSSHKRKIPPVYNK